MHDYHPATPAKSDKNLKEFYVLNQKVWSSWLFADVHIDARVGCGVSRANNGGSVFAPRRGSGKDGSLEITLTSTLTCGNVTYGGLLGDGAVRRRAGQAGGGCGAGAGRRATQDTDRLRATASYRARTAGLGEILCHTKTSVRQRCSAARHASDEAEGGRRVGGHQGQEAVTKVDGDALHLGLQRIHVLVLKHLFPDQTEPLFERREA